MSERGMDELISALDGRDMVGFTRNFVADLASALNTEIDVEPDADWSGVLCLGMGGSGAGGLFLSSLANAEGGMPFVVWRDYGLPSWWGPDWLVLATSYSGNTEEVLDGVQMAVENGGTVVGICSGGALEEILSGSEESLCLSVPGGQMPRSAFGHLFGTQLAACWAIGLLARPSSEEIEEMIERLGSMSIDADISGGNGLVSRMAQSMIGKEVGIVSAGPLAPAGTRFVNQLNENSNRFAGATTLPEMNHNEIVAWADAESDSHAIIYLTADGIHPRTRSRLDWMLENIDISSSWIIDCEGESLLEALIYAAHLTDWISIALALLEGVDPSDMLPIEALKQHLSSIE